MQETGGFRLIVRRGPQPNQTFDLNKDIVTLGRDITNDIVINDPEVSRHHLRFTRGADGYNMEDLGSTNGTFIGGQRLSGVRTLNRGDLIGLGETVTLVYEAARPERAAPSSAHHTGGRIDDATSTTTVLCVLFGQSLQTRCCSYYQRCGFVVPRKYFLPRVYRTGPRNRPQYGRPGRTNCPRRRSR